MADWRQTTNCCISWKIVTQLNLLAPTASAMQYLLDVCYEYGTNFIIYVIIYILYIIYKI